MSEDQENDKDKSILLDSSIDSHSEASKRIDNLKKILVRKLQQEKWIVSESMFNLLIPDSIKFKPSEFTIPKPNISNLKTLDNLGISIINKKSADDIIENNLKKYNW